MSRTESGINNSSRFANVCLFSRNVTHVNAINARLRVQFIFKSSYTANAYSWPISFITSYLQCYVMPYAKIHANNPPVVTRYSEFFEIKVLIATIAWFKLNRKFCRRAIYLAVLSRLLARSISSPANRKRTRIDRSDRVSRFRGSDSPMRHRHDNLRIYEGVISP
jgi:hypothetical protein